MTNFGTNRRQLSKLPKGYVFDSWLKDTSKDAAEYTTRLLHGDIIIAYVGFQVNDLSYFNVFTD